MTELQTTINDHVKYERTAKRRNKPIINGSLEPIKARISIKTSRFYLKESVEFKVLDLGRGSFFYLPISYLHIYISIYLGGCWPKL